MCSSLLREFLSLHFELFLTSYRNVVHHGEGWNVDRGDPCTTLHRAASGGYGRDTGTHPPKASVPFVQDGCRGVHSESSADVMDILRNFLQRTSRNGGNTLHLQGFATEMLALLI